LPKTTTPTIKPTKEKATIKMDDYIDSKGEVSTTKKRNGPNTDNVPVSMSEEEESQMESEDEEKDLKAAPAPTIKEEVPCVSPPVYDDNDDDDDDNEEDDDDNNKEDNDGDNDNEEDVCNFDLNNVEGMSKYKLLRLQRIHRNNAKLASLGLLGGMTSATSPSIDRTNKKKRVATQGVFLRRIQPKHNVFKPTSYKDLDDPVISKRTQSIDSSDTGE